MTIRKFSRIEALRLNLQISSARDLAGALVVVVVIVVALVWSFGSRLNVGAHVWRPDWLCGETLKGLPWCLPAPIGQKKG
jgi:hypothetical protein